MEVITVQSEAYKQLIDKLEQLQTQIIETQAQHPLSEKWLDNQDVCQLLTISKRTLQHYRDKHLLPFSKIGSKIYYKASDIEEHLTRHYTSV